MDGWESARPGKHGQPNSGEKWSSLIACLHACFVMAECIISKAKSKLKAYLNTLIGFERASKTLKVRVCQIL